MESVHQEVNMFHKIFSKRHILFWQLLHEWLQFTSSVITKVLQPFNITPSTKCRDDKQVHLC